MSLAGHDLPAQQQSDAVMVVDGITKRFGGVVAIDNATFTVQRGAITGLIGPNGAGKTTMFDVMTGQQAPDRGRIELDGRDVTSWQADRRARAGLVRTFQIPRPFLGLTVWENLLVAGTDATDEGIVTALSPRGRHPAQGIVDRADDVLALLTLEHLADDMASTLSGGQRKLLELGRAMMRQPDVVLLDEPTAGVAPRLRESLVDRLRGLHEQGLTLVVVEHDLPFVMDLADRLVVMHLGAVLIEGDPDTVRSDQRVLDAYLGGLHG